MLPQRRTAGALGLALVLTGCIHVEGQSSGEMKRALLNSFLFQSSDIYYPDDVAVIPDRLPDLKEDSRRKIEAAFKASLSDLIKANARENDALSRIFERPIDKRIDAKLVVTSTGKPYANTSQDDVITIDVKVAQALYRTALLTGLNDADFVSPLDPATPKPTTEAGYIEAFLKLKHQIASVQGHTVMGDFADVLANDSDNASWFKMSDLAMRSFAMQRHYSSVIQFMLAHELGHIALKHFERLGVPGQSACETRRAIELEADGYAAVLLSLEWAKENATEFFSEEDIGLNDFFEHAYDLSGFETAGVGAECYPPVAERLTLVKAVFASIADAHHAALWSAMEHSISIAPITHDP